jgi:hypothetical protein
MSDIRSRSQISDQQTFNKTTTSLTINMKHIIRNVNTVPFSKFYTYIKWEGIFSDWLLVRFSTPTDGSCLFHAIANSFFTPYHTSMLNGKCISRKTIVKSLRSELSDLLDSSDPNNIENVTYYNTINSGNTLKFSNIVPEFELEYMQNELKSDSYIGYGYMEFIGNILNKDIYILEATRHDIYASDELNLTIKGNRDSIILYYIEGHYELVGLKNKNGSFNTHFSHKHSLIQCLYKRVCEIINKESN